MSCYKNEIIILSPGTKCKKTLRLKEYLLQFGNRWGFEVDITVETDIKKMFRYKTWILPTVIVNNKIVARGYKPGKKRLLRELKRKNQNI